MTKTTLAIQPCHSSYDFMRNARLRMRLKMCTYAPNVKLVVSSLPASLRNLSMGLRDLRSTMSFNRILKFYALSHTFYPPISTPQQFTNSAPFHTQSARPRCAQAAPVRPTRGWPSSPTLPVSSTALQRRPSCRYRRTAGRCSITRAGQHKRESGPQRIDVIAAKL